MTLTEKIVQHARKIGVSEKALKAWRSIKATHDFMPWEFNNKTGVLKRTAGISGITGTVQSLGGRVTPGQTGCRATQSRGRCMASGRGKRNIRT